MDTGMKCTIGCQDCTGLPLKQHCVDAGHVQQEICTDDLPLVSTRRAHAKPFVNSRKTARTEADQVGNTRKRARQSLTPRRTPATTRSKAKAEAASTAAEPPRNGENGILERSHEAQPPCLEFLNPPEANLRSTATAPAVVQAPLYLPKSCHPTEANGNGTAAAPAAVQIAPLNPKNAKAREAMGPVTSAAPTVIQPSPQPPSGKDVETPIVFSDADRERGVEQSTRERVCGSDSHGAEEAELERVPASKQTPVAVANIQMEDLAEKLNPAYDPSWPFMSRFPSSSASALNSVSVEANETRPVPSEVPPVASHGMCGGTLSGAERRVVSEIRVPFSRADGGSVSAQQRVDDNVVAAAAEGSYREERVTLRNAANEGAGSSGHRAVSPGKASTSPGGGGMKGLAAVEESESKIKRTMNQSLLNEPALVVELARFEECQRRELSEEKRQCREELAPLEAELEALKQRLRVRMRDAVERQAEELEIYRAALFGTIGSNVSPSPW